MPHLMSLCQLILQIDAMALPVLNDTQWRAVEYVLQRSEEDSRKASPSLFRRVKKHGYEKEDS